MAWDPQKFILINYFYLYENINFCYTTIYWTTQVNVNVSSVHLTWLTWFWYKLASSSLTLVFDQKWLQGSFNIPAYYSTSQALLPFWSFLDFVQTRLYFMALKDGWESYIFHMCTFCMFHTVSESIATCMNSRGLYRKGHLEHIKLKVGVNGWQLFRSSICISLGTSRTSHRLSTLGRLNFPPFCQSESKMRVKIDHEGSPYAHWWFYFEVEDGEESENTIVVAFPLFLFDFIKK